MSSIDSVNTPSPWWGRVSSSFVPVVPHYADLLEAQRPVSHTSLSVVQAAVAGAHCGILMDPTYTVAGRLRNDAPTPATTSVEEVPALSAMEGSLPPDSNHSGDDGDDDSFVF